MKSNSKHSSASNEHYTPEYIVEPSRKCMNGIDFDPASCDQAQKIVKATKFGSYVPGTLGSFDLGWNGNIFLNPPGGTLRIKKDDSKELVDYKKSISEKYGTGSHTVAWWRKLVQEYDIGNTSQAIFIGFSIEILQTAQTNNTLRNALSFPICVPKERIKFIKEDGSVGKSPTHANVIIGVGVDSAKFKQEFKHIGWCT